MSAKRRHKTMTRDAARAGSDATNANMTGCTEPVMLSGVTTGSTRPVQRWRLQGAQRSDRWPRRRLEPRL